MRECCCFAVHSLNVFTDGSEEAQGEFWNVIGICRGLGLVAVSYLCDFYSIVTREHVKRYSEAWEYGGDEFCIIFSNCTQEQAKNGYGQRFINAVAKNSDKLTMSIGYAQTGPENYLSSDELLQLADQDMYAAKAASKQA